MDIEEDIKALQLDSSEDSVMTNAEDGKRDEAVKPDTIDGATVLDVFVLNVHEMVADDSVMLEECKPDDVVKLDNVEDSRLHMYGVDIVRWRVLLQVKRVFSSPDGQTNSAEKAEDPERISLSIRSLRPV
ncbi:hypothetical protein HAX54_014441 [Datura stramonium]|uniref:Uncharacterized protein n=1 Tax=Datura stramonium TaxID=4076 RepID=A0ABS8RJB5_DATST|nr:hypothetical protein [Datura stramonium]